MTKTSGEMKVIILESTSQCQKEEIEYREEFSALFSAVFVSQTYQSSELRVILVLFFAS
jgi:hypothetical protein